MKQKKTQNEIFLHKDYDVCKLFVLWDLDFVDFVELVVGIWNYFVLTDQKDFVVSPYLSNRSKVKHYINITSNTLSSGN